MRIDKTLNRHEINIIVASLIGELACIKFNMSRAWDVESYDLYKADLEDHMRLIQKLCDVTYGREKRGE